MPDERDQMLTVIWQEKKPDILKPVDETMPIYDPSEIYTNPAQHMTVRGIFRYVGVDVI